MLIHNVDYITFLKRQLFRPTLYLTMEIYEKEDLFISQYYKKILHTKLKVYTTP